MTPISSPSSPGNGSQPTTRRPGNARRAGGTWLLICGLLASLLIGAGAGLAAPADEPPDKPIIIDPTPQSTPTLAPTPTLPPPTRTPTAPPELPPLPTQTPTASPVATPTPAMPPTRIPTPVPPPAGITLPALDFADMRGVNYVISSADDPLRCPDLHYGQDSNCPWHIEAIARDMDRLSALGVNTIRIFLNYYAFGGARQTNPAYTLDEPLAHLDALIYEANQRGIYVMPVLLAKYPQDRFGPQHYQTALDLHVWPVVNHLAGHPGVIAWDLFNEPDIGSPVDARCWDWSNSDHPRCFGMANERIHFLRVVREVVRLADPDTPITVSLAFAKNYFQPRGTDLYMADLVEFMTFHYYDIEPYDSGRYAEHWYYGQGFPADLRQALAELRVLGKPIVVTELGFPAGPGSQRTMEDLQRDRALAVQIVQQEYASGILLWPFQRHPEDVIGNVFRPDQAQGDGE